MASIERTAYPVFARGYTQSQLELLFSPSEDEIRWVKKTATTAALQLGLAVLLKCFQQLCYFPAVSDIPPEILDQVRKGCGFGDRVKLNYSAKNTIYRHMASVRDYLSFTPFYGTDSPNLIKDLAQEAALLLDQRADLINYIIDEMVRKRFELPAFSTLDIVAEQAHVEAQDAICNLVVDRTPMSVITRLIELLDTDFGRRQSDFNALKTAPRKPSRKHLEVLIDHLSWLEEFGDLERIFDGVIEPKIRRFSSQAAVLDVAEMKNFESPRVS